jgi:hypothetical protein
VLRLLLLPLGLQHEVSRPGSLEAKMGVKWGGGHKVEHMRMRRNPEDG